MRTTAKQSGTRLNRFFSDSVGPSEFHPFLTLYACVHSRTLFSPPPINAYACTLLAICSSLIGGVQRARRDARYPTSARLTTSTKPSQYFSPLLSRQFASLSGQKNLRWSIEVAPIIANSWARRASRTEESRKFSGSRLHFPFLSGESIFTKNIRESRTISSFSFRSAGYSFGDHHEGNRVYRRRRELDSPKKWSMRKNASAHV